MSNRKEIYKKRVDSAVDLNFILSSLTIINNDWYMMVIGKRWYIMMMSKIDDSVFDLNVDKFIVWIKLYFSVGFAFLKVFKRTHWTSSAIASATKMFLFAISLFKIKMGHRPILFIRIQTVSIHEVHLPASIAMLLIAIITFPFGLPTRIDELVIHILGVPVDWVLELHHLCYLLVEDEIISNSLIC